MARENIKIIAVLPAYNAERTLKKTYDDIPKEWADDIILVDDASRDNTVQVARALGLKTFVHEKNLGYGGNQKTCYKEALKLGADIAVMIHPDHQYDPKAIPELLKPIIAGEADAVLGSRMMAPRGALDGGMPYWKYLANISLTKVENAILGLGLTEYHSGFRAYSACALASIPLHENSDNFVFDTEIIVQLKMGGFKIKEVPIKTSYFPEASSVGFLKSCQYGLSILGVMAKYLVHKIGVKKYPGFAVKSKTI